MSTTLLARSQAERLGAIAHPSLLIGDRQEAVFAACEQQHLARSSLQRRAAGGQVSRELKSFSVAAAAELLR
jgi:hypothetical protein